MPTMIDRMEKWIKDDKLKLTPLPNIRQAYYPNIVKSLRTGFYYEDTKDHIDGTNNLIGIDESKYERNEAADSIGFHAYKIKA